MAAIGEFVHWVGLPIHIRSKKNTGFVVDRGGDPGVHDIHIWVCEEGHKNMTFSVDADGRIHSVDNPDWILDAGAKNEFKVNVKTIQLSKNQNIANQNRVKWKLHKDGKIESIAYPGKFFDILDGKMVNGSKIILWKDNGGSNQRWELTLANKLYDGSNIKGMYDSATSKSSLSLSEYARAYNAPFIMELSIEGYDSCLEIPYESFEGPSSKYSIIFCILSIMFVIFASILIYDYIRRDRYTVMDVSMEDDYWDSPPE